MPRPLFNIRHQYNENGPFQVMPGGQGFLISQLDQEFRGAHLNLVQNWLQRLPAE